MRTMNAANHKILTLQMSPESGLIGIPLILIKKKHEVYPKIRVSFIFCITWHSTVQTIYIMSMNVSKTPNNMIYSL